MLKEFLASEQDGVFVIGHSSALIRIDGSLILTDPVWGDYKPYGDNWAFVPEQVNCDEILDKINYCTVSHVHADHSNPQLLKKLSGADLIIMNGRAPLVERMSQTKGSYSLIQLFPWEWYSVEGEPLEFYFVPHAFNAIDSSVFIRSKKTGYCVYHGNDNFLVRTQLEQLMKDVPRVDVAMIPMAFVHWFPWLMKNMTDEQKKKESERLNAQSIEQAKMFMNFLKPKHAIPFGASLFYRGGKDHPLNKTLATPFDLPGAHPMIAGDYILADGTRTQLTGRAQYRDLFDTKALDPSPNNSNYATHVGQSHLEAIAKKVSRATFRIKNHDIVVNGIVINCEDLSVRTGPFGLHHYHHFEFEPWEFRQWVNGEITFEEAIGTRKFMCTREPNVYDYRVFDFMNQFL